MVLLTVLRADALTGDFKNCIILTRQMQSMKEKIDGFDNKNEAEGDAASIRAKNHGCRIKRII